MPIVRIQEDFNEYQDYHGNLGFRPHFRQQRLRRGWLTGRRGSESVLWQTVVVKQKHTLSKKKKMAMNSLPREQRQAGIKHSGNNHY